MLTTKDNPYNPYTEYDQWLRWDQENGYFTNELLARVANPSLDIENDDELDELHQMACAFIVKWHPSGQYIVIDGPDRE